MIWTALRVRQFTLTRCLTQILTGQYQFTISTTVLAYRKLTSSDVGLALSIFISFSIVEYSIDSGLPHA